VLSGRDAVNALVRRGVKVNLPVSAALGVTSEAYLRAKEGMAPRSE
jgi:hypothetical protein